MSCLTTQTNNLLLSSASMHFASSQVFNLSQRFYFGNRSQNYSKLINSLSEIKFCFVFTSKLWKEGENLLSDLDLFCSSSRVCGKCGAVALTRVTSFCTSCILRGIFFCCRHKQKPIKLRLTKASFFDVTKRLRSDERDANKPFSWEKSAWNAVVWLGRKNIPRKMPLMTIFRWTWADVSRF